MYLSYYLLHLERLIHVWCLLFLLILWRHKYAHFCLTPNKFCINHSRTALVALSVLRFDSLLRQPGLSSFSLRYEQSYSLWGQLLMNLFKRTQPPELFIAGITAAFGAFCLFCGWEILHLQRPNIYLHPRFRIEIEVRVVLPLKDFLSLRRSVYTFVSRLKLRFTEKSLNEKGFTCWSFDKKCENKED